LHVRQEISEMLTAEQKSLWQKTCH